MNFKPPRDMFKIGMINALLLFASVFITASLLFADVDCTGRWYGRFCAVNTQAVKEALSHAGLVLLLVTMSLGILVICLAGNIQSETEREECLGKIKPQPAFCWCHDDWCCANRLCLYRDFPESYPMDESMSSKGSVWAYLFVLELAIGKVGATVTSTACGAAFFLCWVAHLEWWIFGATVLVLYGVAIFPNFIRWRVSEILATPYDPAWYRKCI